MQNSTEQPPWETVSLVMQAVAENRRAYVRVNNRAEGKAPLTVETLVDQLHAYFSVHLFAPAIKLMEISVRVSNQSDCVGEVLVRGGEGHHGTELQP